MSYSISIKTKTTRICQQNDATIQVRNDANEVVADVFVEIYNGMPRLVITPAILARNSDEPTRVISLMTGDNLPT